MSRHETSAESSKSIGLRMPAVQLEAVQQIHATANAFAAFLADGRVVTWGDPDAGGDSTRVRYGYH
eukprot:Skav216977  [mRNA]  locus=scaffold594:89274:89471:- [translate_table: standard]